MREHIGIDNRARTSLAACAAFDGDQCKPIPVRQNTTVISGISRMYTTEHEANMSQKNARRTTQPKSGTRRTAQHSHVTGGGMKGTSANEASIAAQEAWSAVKEAVRSGRAQPVVAARATGKAVRNVARSGARQTGVAAHTIVRATDEVLISAMHEATKAAQVARAAAKDVERSVAKAVKAIKNALRKRSRLAVNEATRKRPSAALKKATRKHRGVPRR
jgi:hypothetical protein